MMRNVIPYLAPMLAGIAFALLGVQLISPDPPEINHVEILTQQATPSATDSRSGPYSYASAVEKAAPSVVNIYTKTRVRQSIHPLFNDPFFQQFFGDRNPLSKERIQASLGSGVIVTKQGYIITNNHVIENADTISVALRDGREVNATLVGSDPEIDLALLKVDLADLPAIVLNTNSEPRVGDVVLAIGNPFGVGQTVTMGIISATNRAGLGLNTYENFIQTDAAINPGNSGGALIDAEGNLVGINTAIFSKSGGSQGIGFAIPANITAQAISDFIANGRIVRGWLGVEVQKLTPALAESFGMTEHRGVLIAGIFRNGPAHLAGLSPGDIIVELDGQEITNSDIAMKMIADLRPGNVVKIGYLRDGKRRDTEAQIIERPARK